MAASRKRKRIPKNTRRSRGRRTNRERSLLAYRTGSAAHVPITTPTGEAARKHVSPGSRHIVRDKRAGPCTSTPKPPGPASIPTLAQFLSRWLSDVVRPNRELATYAYYEVMVRRYIIPALGSTRLDQIQLHEVQTWLDELASACQCCAQGKDAALPEHLRQCCAVGTCCKSYPGLRTVQAARNTLRAALNHAKDAERLVTRNVAALAQLPDPSSRHRRAGWSVEEATRFLTSAQDDRDPLLAAYVMILVNGLSRGETLGLTWPSVDLDASAVDACWQLQRVHGELIHRRTTAVGSDADRAMPMPEICVAALRLHRDQQAAAREQAGDRWQASGLVFTTRWGTPIEPRNFYRSFQTRCVKAGVTRIGVHDTRHTCAALLAALGVQPIVMTRILQHARIAMPTEVHIEACSDTTRAALRKLTEDLDCAPNAGSPATEPDAS